MSEDQNNPSIEEDEGGGGGAPAWMATYGDLVTLLFAFFVLMFAMSTVQDDKFEQLKQTLKDALGTAEIPEAGTREGLSMKDIDGKSTPDAVDELGGMIQKLDQKKLDSEVKEFIMFNKLAGQVSVKKSDEGSIITLSDAILFDVGQADIKPAGADLMQKLSEILKQFDYRIRVVGHTDNVPLGKSSKYDTNWELSASRACDIVKMLIKEGLNPGQLSAEGRSHYNPITSNATPEGRARNRRVELIYERVKVDKEKRVDVDQYNDYKEPQKTTTTKSEESTE